MLRRATTALAGVLLLLAPAASRASLSPYSQNFETLTITDPAALANDGWWVYGNVFNPSMVYLYGYGSYPAPNAGNAFCDIDAGQGGSQQGAQQLSIYSDYNNTDHAAGNWIESNTFHEQTIGAADAGTIWKFQFDAKLGNLVAPSTALAFIKTLNPSAGWATTNFITVTTTAIPATWNTYSISIPITAGLVGQVLQFGFANTATGYASSGVFYDNLSWMLIPADVPGSPSANHIELRAASPNPFANATRIEYSLVQRGPAEVAVFDVAGRRVATLFSGMVEPGPHAVTWDGRFADGRLAPAGVYECVLQSAGIRQTRSVVLSR